ncbi:MAG: undecaprenyl-diphosphate phosphatase, partial [Streptosporangiaceae bacterium]
RIIGGLLHTLRTRRVETSTERLAWLIVVATIPVGITGLALEHLFRTLFAVPLVAAVFLTINGIILLAGERLRRRAEARHDWNESADAALVAANTDAASAAAISPARGGVGVAAPASRQLSTLAYREAAVIGLFQTFALLAGISRSGITMVAGLARGLDHEDAARFSFLLATPVILAAGVLKLPSLAGSAAANIHGQVLVGMLTAGVAAYLSVRFLVRYFQTRTLTPFAIYCLVVGLACTVKFSVWG